VETFEKVIFADISPLYWNFRMCHQDELGKIKNKHRIFTWENGILYSHSLIEKDIEFNNVKYHKGEIINDELMYTHFLRREISIKFLNIFDKSWLIIPNQILNYDKKITSNVIKKYSQNNMIKYWFDFIKRKWRKVTPKVFSYIRNRLIVSKKGN
jgi:hypothetical protein